jgi:3-hydroxyisobutyrate dehydrogenase-like beta-hydroxyacid dehydrogenase
MSVKKIGFIGLGNMGRGMCENIAKKGYPTTVYDKSPKAMANFEGKATLATSSLEVFKASDVIFLSLPNSDIVEAVVGEFLELGVKEKTVVDTSTSYPDSTKMLYEKFKSQGGIFLDAPLLGGPANTASGTAPCMISGDKEDVDSVTDIIACYATPINYFGPIGSAHTVKIAMNFTSLMYAALASQMFPLMEKLGIDTKHLFKIMKEGSAGNGPFNFYGRKFVEKDYHLDFALELALKDMVYMKRLYDKFNVPAFLLDGGFPNGGCRRI